MRRVSLGTLALLLAGCAMGPDFQPPKPDLPDHWNQGPPAPVLSQWWTAFGDAELTALENRVAEANLDVRAATLRLAESRAQRRIAGAAEFPQVTGQAFYQHIKPSAKGLFSQLGQSANSGPPPNNIPASDLYQYGFDASWEIDLWGKVRRSLESANAEVDASAEARRGALLSVLAEVARDYVQLRGLQTQLRISRDNLAVAEDIAALTKKRADQGLSSQLDVAQAGAQVATVAAAIPRLEQQQAQTIDQLSFLLGQPPGTLAAELETPQAVPPPPPDVPLGIPSELAHRRPDIRQAEAELHAATAQIGVAEANFYPSITLSASFALQSTRFADLANWASRNETVGPILSLPIFEGGRLTGNLHLTEARQQEAALTYQRTVLAAWQEVSDSLIAYQAEGKRREKIEQAVQENRRALKLAREDYRQGTVSFLQVLTAQQQLLQMQQQEADSTATVSADLVALCKALGGGWETAFPEMKN